jgi:hypothetical protein
LEQQDGEARLPALRGERAAFGERLQRERRGRERKRHAGNQRDAHVEAAGERRSGDHGDRAEHLGKPEHEEARAHVPEPVRLELEADQEEQEHDAELGEGIDRLGLADELQAPGADGDAGKEIARHRAQAQTLGGHDREHRGCEIDCRLPEQDVAVLHTSSIV